MAAVSAAPESTFLREVIVGAAPAANELVGIALVVIAGRGRHRHAPAALSSLRSRRTSSPAQEH